MRGCRVSHQSVDAFSNQLNGCYDTSAAWILLQVHLVNARWTILKWSTFLQAPLHT